MGDELGRRDWLVSDETWAEGWDLERVLARLRERVTALGPGPCVEERHPGYVRLRFPLPPGSEYAFAADVYDGLENLELTAELPRAEGEAPFCFWVLALERMGAGPFEEMLASFERSLVALLRHPTRIRQTRKLLSWSFRCEYFDEGWIGLGGVSVLRADVSIPAIAGRERIYSAAAWSDGPAPATT